MVSAAKIDRVETMQPPIESSDENESDIPSVTGSKQSFLLRHKKKIAALSLALVTATAIAIAVHLSVKVGPTNSNSNNSSNVSTSKIKSDPFDNTKHNFSGDISQFISTKEIFKKQSIYGNSQCDASRGLWNFELFTDDYPWETDWELLYVGRIGYFFADFGLEDSVVALGPPAGTNYERRTLYKGYLCLPVGNFVLRMKDLEGDGICCDFGEGYFTVKVNGNVVAENDPDNDSYTVQDFPFEVTSSGVDTSSPTGSPTYSPTEVNEICSVFVDSCEEYSEFLPALAGMDTGTEAEYDMLVAACEGYTVCCESVETTNAAFAACWNQNCPKLTDESTEEEITECFLSLANGND